MITKTDKSGRLFVSSMEGYRGGGMKHVGVDRKVTREEARAIERRLENLGELSVKCMGMGEAHVERNVVRVRKAYTTKAGTIPPLYTMQNGLPQDLSVGLEWQQQAEWVINCVCLWRGW